MCNVSFNVINFTNFTRIKLHKLIHFLFQKVKKKFKKFKKWRLAYTFIRNLVLLLNSISQLFRSKRGNWYQIEFQSHAFQKD